MPVKVRRARRKPWTVTDEIVEAYRTALDTAEVYIACIPGEGCSAPNLQDHCETCRTHIEANRTLTTALGLRPWQPSVTYITGPAEDAEVWEMRLAIEERLAEGPERLTQPASPARVQMAI